MTSLPNLGQAICLISLYISFTNVKGNQSTQLILDPRRKFRTQIDLSQRFLMDFKNFNIFEQEIMPSRAWDAVTIILYTIRARKIKKC